MEKVNQGYGPSSKKAKKKKSKKEYHEEPLTKKKGKKRKRRDTDSETESTFPVHKLGKHYTEGAGGSKDDDQQASLTTKTISKVKTNDDDEIQMVVFDLETTGMDITSEIIQLAALHPTRNQSFEKYILPIQQINPGATNVNHLSKSGGNLLYKGKPVITEPVRAVLVGFINWLPNKALLVAHNCKGFDSVILVAQLKKYDLIDAFSAKVNAFSDSLPLFQRKYPFLRRHTQELLAMQILRETYSAHNAKNDVTILQRLLKEANSNINDLLSHSFTIPSVPNRIGY